MLMSRIAVPSCRRPDHHLLMAVKRVLRVPMRQGPQDWAREQRVARRSTWRPANVNAITKVVSAAPPSSQGS